MDKLMTAKEYREKQFTGERPPSIKTIINWIRKGKLAGKRIGSMYFVNVDAERRKRENDGELSAWDEPETERLFAEVMKTD